MLKLAPNKVPPKTVPVPEPEPAPEVTPQATPVTPDPADDAEPDSDEGDKLPQELVLYMGAENGPFQCDHCRYFQEPNLCSKVADEVDPGGHCNIFHPMDTPAELQEAPEAPVTKP